VGRSGFAHAQNEPQGRLNCLCNSCITNLSYPLSQCHKRAPYQDDQSGYSLLGSNIVLLAFITARIRAKRAYVWKPAVTLTDPRIVSELTGSFN